MLTAQPWGRQYQDRGNTTPEQRTTAQLQQELYFKRLAYCDPYLWESVCEWYATGDHWPSIEEVKQTIAQNSPQPKQEPLIEPNWSSAPEPLALLMAHAKREAVTIQEAALAVLPGWIQANPTSLDRQDAQAFLVAAQGRFGLGRQ